MRPYPRSLIAPNGHEIITVHNAEQEARVRARFSGDPEPVRREPPPKPVMRRKGRTPNVRKP